METALVNLWEFNWKGILPRQHQIFTPPLTSLCCYCFLSSYSASIKHTFFYPTYFSFLVFYVFYANKRVLFFYFLFFTLNLSWKSGGIKNKIVSAQNLGCFFPHLSIHVCCCCSPLHTRGLINAVEGLGEKYVQVRIKQAKKL